MVHGGGGGRGTWLAGAGKLAGQCGGEDGATGCAGGGVDSCGLPPAVQEGGCVAAHPPYFILSSAILSVPSAGPEVRTVSLARNVQVHAASEGARVGCKKTGTPPEKKSGCMAQMDRGRTTELVTTARSGRPTVAHRKESKKPREGRGGRRESMVSGKGGQRKDQVNTLQSKTPPTAQKGTVARVPMADPSGAAHSLLALTCTPV